MADKILTFNGMTISGPSGTGMVMVKEPEPPIYGNGVTIDGKTYSTVIIGNREWMAENLSAQSFGGMLRDSNINYGRFYSATEMRSISVPGWHIPSYEDVQSLLNSSENDIKKLISVDEWTYTSGTDYFGIAFKPYAWGFRAGTYETAWGNLGQELMIWLIRNNTNNLLWIQSKSSNELKYSISGLTDEENAKIIASIRLVKDL